MADLASSAPPKGLSAAGQRLWADVLADIEAAQEGEDAWELDRRELELLARACRCADELALLDAAVDRDGVTVEGSRGQVTVHPALSEARQLRLVQLRLLGAIEMCDPQSAVRSATPAQAQAKRAAGVRWERTRAEHG